MVEKIRTEFSSRALEVMTDTPVLGCPTTTPSGARLFVEADQIFQKIGERITDAKCATILDLGLDETSGNYISEWIIDFTVCNCAKQTKDKVCICLLELLDFMQISHPDLAKEVTDAVAGG